MAEEPALSEEENEKLLSVHEKMTLARRIIKEIDTNDDQMNVDKSQWVNIVKKYTGVDESLIHEAIKQESEKRTFNDWYKQVSYQKSPSFHYFRRAIIDLYTNKLIIPNKKDIIESLFEQYYRFPQDDDALFYILKNEGFIWKRLGETNKFVIMEDPEQMFKRMRYLEKIQQYRAEGRYLVYIYNGMKLPKLRFRNNVVIVSPAPKRMTYYAPETISVKATETWIISTVLPRVPKNTVFIIEDNKASALYKTRKAAETLTPYSSKQDIIRWLRAHNIYSTRKMHKVDLYLLMEKNANTNANYEFGDDLGLLGYDVLFRPCDRSHEGYFNFIESRLRDGPTCHNSRKYKMYINKVLSGVTPDIWKISQQNVEVIENKMLEEDRKMELLLVNLFSAVKSGELNEEDIAHCEESINVDAYIDNILFK